MGRLTGRTHYAKTRLFPPFSERPLQCPIPDRSITRIDTWGGPVPFVSWEPEPDYSGRRAAFAASLLLDTATNDTGTVLSSVGFSTPSRQELRCQSLKEVDAIPSLYLATPPYIDTQHH